MVGIDESDFTWLVLSAFGALGGFGGIVWAVARRTARNDADHAHIISLLKTVSEVDASLADVLQHPNDTAFSVEPVVREVQRMRDELKHVSIVLDALLEIERKRTD